MKTCKGCQQELALTHFYKANSNKGNKTSLCKGCYRLKYPTKHSLERRLKEQYDLTLEQYEDILVAQDEACAICDIIFTPRNPPWVDHDHATGKVRGILCRVCNTGLGMLGDNAEGILKALQYLLPGSGDRTSLEG